MFKPSAIKRRFHGLVLVVAVFVLTPGCDPYWAGGGPGGDPWGEFEIFIEGDSPPTYRWEPDIGATSIDVGLYTCYDADGVEVEWGEDYEDLEALLAYRWELLEAGGDCGSSTIWSFETTPYSDEEVFTGEGEDYAALWGMHKSMFSGPISHGTLPEGDIIECEHCSLDALHADQLYSILVRRSHDQGHETDGYVDSYWGSQFFWGKSAIPVQIMR
jgi:hypothetical protein